MSEAEGKGSHFDPAAFAAGTQSNRYLNSPAGLLFNSDPGIPKATPTTPPSTSASHRRRVGPDGERTAGIRASYGIIYNYHILYYNQIAYDAPPWGGSL